MSRRCASRTRGRSGVGDHQQRKGDAVYRAARVLALAGRPRPAALVLSSASALLEEIGAKPPWLATITDQALSAIRAQLDEAALADAWEQGRTLTADEAVVLALELLD